MFKDISLGKYYETDSVIHKADPRIKFVLYIVYVVAIFTVRTIPGLIALTGVTLLMFIAAKIPPSVMWSSVKPVVPIAVFIFIINILSIRSGKILWEWGIIKVTDESLFKAFLMMMRLLFLIVITSILLTLTTTPLKISDALEKLFGPLKKIRVPVHEVAMMMSIALRFIPTLTEEAQKIMKAQVSRGADFDTGSFVRRLKGYVTVIIPLFVSSFKRADELATAMDARCYRGGEGRTKLNPLRIVPADILTGFLLLAGAAVIFMIR